MRNRSKNSQKQCSSTHGERYVSRTEAKAAILDIKINSAINGSRGDENREARICKTCGGWHVVACSRRERG